MMIFGLNYYFGLVSHFLLGARADTRTHGCISVCDFLIFFFLFISGTFNSGFFTNSMKIPTFIFAMVL